MLRYAIGAAAFALAVGSIDPAAAQRVKAGVLTCDVSAGIGFIIGSQKTVSCVFAPEPAGPQQVYSGSISKFGLDIGVTSSGVMIWGVFTDSMGPQSRLSRRRLFRRDRRGHNRRRPGRQCSGRRLQPHGRAAAGLGGQLGRTQSRRGGR
jgi:hypothetical protein